MYQRYVFVFLFLIFSSLIHSQVKGKVNKEKVRKENRILKKKIKKNNKTPKKLDVNMESIDRTKPVRTGKFMQGIPEANKTVVQVETAIPAFIGYTEKGPDVPTKISSMADYMNIFGGPSDDEIGVFEIDTAGNINSPGILATPKYKMFYMLKMFFANGGRDCFITSVGHYNENSVNNEKMLQGLSLLNNEDLPTLILFPDAGSSKNNDDPTELYKSALAQCATRKDRFLICDVKEIENKVIKSVNEFRTSIGINNLEFGAAYFPFLKSTLNYIYAEDKIEIKLKGTSRTSVLKHSESTILKDSSKTNESLYHIENGRYRDLYHQIVAKIEDKKLVLPPSAAIAGVYASVDANRGVWKAPANISLNRVEMPTIEIDDNSQAFLQVSSTGKSINPIRKFSQQGVLVWGARTLAGNNPEWRYISVRRLANVIEESVRNTTKLFSNEPNDKSIWLTVKALTEDYLYNLWKTGALNGNKPNRAYFVRVGLGETMTSQDVQDKNMIVEIGIAITKPAEFTVLRFSQKMEKK